MNGHEPIQNNGPNRNGQSKLPETQEVLRLPEQIARYRVERLLGQGGFGYVYLVHDDQTLVRSLPLLYQRRETRR